MNSDKFKTQQEKDIAVKMLSVIPGINLSDFGCVVDEESKDSESQSESEEDEEMNVEEDKLQPIQDN